MGSLSVLPVYDPSGVFPGFAQICSLQVPQWLNPVEVLLVLELLAGSGAVGLAAVLVLVEVFSP